jgi:hypothetical protein
MRNVAFSANCDRSALGGPSDSFRLAQMPVGVEKLLPAKFAKMKLRQDAL